MENSYKSTIIQSVPSNEDRTDELLVLRILSVAPSCVTRFRKLKNK